MALTLTQEYQIHRLQREIKDLDLQADKKWAEFLRTNDEDCFNQVQALDGEAAMLAAVAYIPKAGERKVGTIKDLLSKLKNRPLELKQNWEARLKTLDAINEWRREYELPPLDRLPPGQVGNSSLCPIAQAFRRSLLELGATYITVAVAGANSITLDWEDKNGKSHSTTPRLTPTSAGPGLVIMAFDNFRFPDLIEDLDLEMAKLWDTRSPASSYFRHLNRVGEDPMQLVVKKRELQWRVCSSLSGLYGSKEFQILHDEAVRRGEHHEIELENSQLVNGLFMYVESARYKLEFGMDAPVIAEAIRAADRARTAGKELAAQQHPSAKRWS